MQLNWSKAVRGYKALRRIDCYPSQSGLGHRYYL